MSNNLKVGEVTSISVEAYTLSPYFGWVILLV